MKKQLLIIGCYLDTELKHEILSKNVSRLKDSFDIMLVSHLPISEEFQKLVKYIIYDSNNDVKFDEGYIQYFLHGSVYYQRHMYYSINPSCAVYKNIRNALPFAKSVGYDSFFYMEADTLISEKDIGNLFNLKKTAEEEKKSACFFNTYKKDWLEFWLFYSEIDFYMYNTPVLHTFDEFEDYCNRIGSYPTGVVEFLVYHLLYMNHPNKIKVLPDSLLDYFPNSNFNITRSDKSFNESENSLKIAYYNEEIDKFIDYNISIAKLIDTNRIFIIYSKGGWTSDKSIPKTDIKVYVNDNIVLTIDNPDTSFECGEYIGQGTVMDIKVVDCGHVMKQHVISPLAVLDNKDYIKFNN